MTPLWREHPKLQGRFHPEFPDDVQVVCHDGNPGRSGRRPEVVWARVTGCDGDVFSGVVLNQPQQLRDVSAGSNILFIVPQGGEYPLQVTRKYLEERSTWRLLMPYKTCGLTELLDPPSELVASSFPTITAESLQRGFVFTTRCGICGDGMVVRLKRMNWPWSEPK